MRGKGMDTRKEVTTEIAKLIGDRLGNGWGYSANQLKCAEEIYDTYVKGVAEDITQAVKVIEEQRKVIHQNEAWAKLIINNAYDLIKIVGEKIKTAFYAEFEELIPSIMADKIDEIVKQFTDKKSE